jgi:Rrf2 family iron-sulfur cluster assembly transcriptional regulator
MRLSTKGRYAVMAMADLARNGQGEGAEMRAVSLAEIAARQEISLSYLEQLFARLRRAGLVNSVRGPGGGYRLAKTAAQTVVAEIVLAVDEPIRATRCSGQGSPRGCMVGGERCITHHLWEDLGLEIHRYLASVSLEDVIANRLGRRDGAAMAGVAA